MSENNNYILPGDRLPGNSGPVVYNDLIIIVRPPFAYLLTSLLQPVCKKEGQPLLLKPAGLLGSIKPSKEPGPATLIYMDR